MKFQRILLLSLLAGACAPSAPAEAPPVESQKQTEAPTNRIDVPATVRRNLGIVFAAVEARHVEQTLRVPGSFELEPLARREYRMALPGRVELLVDQYDEVSIGQTLYRYQSPAWPELLHEIILGEQAMDAAASELAVGEARMEESRKRLRQVQSRLEALAEAGFKQADVEAGRIELEASLPRLDAEIELARTRLENAKRTYQHALHRAAAASEIDESELASEVVLDGVSVPNYSTIDWIEVRAVRAGVVERLAVTDGAFVEPPSNVLSVVDPTAVRFRGLALQADLGALGDDVQARVVPPPSPEMPVADAVPAAMTIGLEAHPHERTVTLLARPVSGAPWIRPGISAFLEVVVSSSGGPRLAVPRSAIVQDGLEHVFFMRDPADPDQVIRVSADMGAKNEAWVVLESDVARGDEVVVSGAYELKLASQGSGADQGGHFHADGSFHDDH